MNPVNTITISTDDYSVLIRRSVLLDVILACNVDKKYPSEMEKEVLRIRQIVGPENLAITEQADEGEGDDA